MAEPPIRLPHSSQSVPQGTAVWHYDVEGTVHGPLNFRDLKELVEQRKITEKTLVWQTSDPVSHPAAQILGLFPKAKSKEPEETVPESKISDRNPYATPRSRTIQDGPPGGLYLPHLRSAHFSILVLALLVSTSLLIGSFQIANPDTRTIALSLSGMGFLYWFVLGLVYLHRAWEMMHMFGAKLNGSKATRFMILPLFNALWSFVSLYGWAKLWNFSQKAHPGLSLAPRVWKPAFFIFPIFFLVSQGLLLMHFVTREWPADPTNLHHQISLGIFAGTLLTGMFCWFQMTRSINFLARKKS